MMRDDEAEAVTNLGAHLAAAHEVIAEQLEIRKRLEAELAEAQAREARLREALKRGNGAYQVSLADQDAARREAKELREENARLRYALRFAFGYVPKPNGVTTDAFRSRYEFAHSALLSEETQP